MSDELGSSLSVWRSDLLASLPGVRHAVTRRVAGMGRANGNVGFSPPRDRDDAWAMRQQWCAAAGFCAERLVTLGQVHGADVHLVTTQHAGRGARPGSAQIGIGDGLMTNEPGPVLMTLHADCQPVLFAAPATRRRGAVVAVAHAGWRGTVGGIVAQTLGAMTAVFGVRAEDVHVALGPAIGACCYEVGDDVADAWRGVAGSESAIALASENGRYRFALSAANLLLLARAGVRPDRIELAQICTRCDGANWFSHRGQGADTGRFGSMIAIAAPNRVASA